MAYDNELSGALFKNDKRRNEKDPLYKGSIQIDGKEYWLSSWINEKKDGSGKYMSLKAQPKQQQNQSAPDPFADNNLSGRTDEIPFS